MHTCYQPDLQVGELILAEDEASHVVRVLRMGEGQAIRLIDGVGGVAEGILASVGKKKASVIVKKVDREVTRPQGLILIVAPTKATDRFEWLLEKATELNVEEVIPVWTEHSERRVDKHERWKKVVVAATKQCQRMWMPKLHRACAIQELFQQHPALRSRPGAVAHCMDDLRGVSPRESWVEWQSDRTHAWLAVGPEGDFTGTEVRFLVDCDAQAIHFGPLRLRTETAGVAAIAQFQRVI